MTTPAQKVANLKRAFADHDIPWPKTTALYWHPTGPLVNFVAGMFRVSDLNPEKHIQWRMSRLEMFKFGLRCIVASLRA